jgi:hypothetical protein
MRGILFLYKSYRLTVLLGKIKKTYNIDIADRLLKLFKHAIYQAYKFYICIFVGLI